MFSLQMFCQYMYHRSTLSYDRITRVQNNIIYVEKEIILWEPI
jgi:hypothetical protein